LQGLLRGGKMNNVKAVLKPKDTMNEIIIANDPDLTIGNGGCYGF